MAESPSTPKTCLPGYGMPVHSSVSSAFGERVDQDLKTTDRPNGQISSFNNALKARAEFLLLTAREYVMIDFMNQITDLVEWDKKVFDQETVARWRAEALDSGEDMSGKMLDWCILELKDKAASFQESGIVAALDWAVYKSDNIIPSEMKTALKLAVAPLEDVPEALKDFHPGSDDRVFDLVHPSLFPLIYGHTKILETGTIGLDDCIRRSGDGVTLQRPSKDGLVSYEQDMWSDSFQWLPCDIAPLADGTLRIKSYINNLHPQRHKDLYEVIEKIIAKVIPMWNMTLEDIFDAYYCEPRIIPDKDGPWVMPKEAGMPAFMAGAYEAEKLWVLSKRILILPEPAKYKSPQLRSREKHWYRRDSPKKIDILQNGADHNLQVIVKLANIELSLINHHTQEAPGTLEPCNEHICATAIYYYDDVNITDSDLTFRAQVDSNILHSYENQDDEGIGAIYGVDNEGPAVQNLGAVLTKAGRVLTFPNTYQHRVNEFQLQDPTQPGYRKILALFLVDPHLRVISTSNVPCQQASWWQDDIKGIGLLSSLPPELLQQVVENVDGCPFASSFAKEQHICLIEERDRCPNVSYQSI